VVGQCGNGYLLSDWQSAGFIYAADNGAKVANLSSGASSVVIDAARYAYEKDVCITTSAGNDSLPISKAMCDEPWVCTVVAVDPYDVKAWYSDYGWVATVAAPGGDHQPGLWSTTPNNSHNGNSYYNAYSGTSMSSPVAAGVLGLIRSQHPEWTALQAYYQLVGTTDPIDDLNPRFAGLLGSGRINAYRAVTETVVPKPKISCDRIEFFDPSGNNNGLAERVRMSMSFFISKIVGQAVPELRPKSFLRIVGLRSSPVRSTLTLCMELLIIP
jgi:subtilisin family serine protease